MQSLNSCGRILLAEDNDSDAMLVEEALRFHAIDYELVRARDGEAALEFVDAVERDAEMPTPRIFLLDLYLPKCDGLEIIQKIRMSPRCCGIPIVAMSASDAPRDRAAVRSYAAVYFRKPADLDSSMELGAVVREAVRSL